MHRHFPTKEALIDAVVAVRLDRLADRANDLRTQSNAEFFAFVTELADQARNNLVLASALGGTLGVDGNQAAVRLADALGQLLAGAQQSGTVRDDLTVAELHAAIAGAVTIEQRLPPDRQGLGLEIVLTGLRAPAHRPN